MEVKPGFYPVEANVLPDGTLKSPQMLCAKLTGVCTSSYFCSSFAGNIIAGSQRIDEDVGQEMEYLMSSYHYSVAESIYKWEGIWDLHPDVRITHTIFSSDITWPPGGPREWISSYGLDFCQFINK